MNHAPAPVQARGEGYRLGFDIGGTFTDFVLASQEGSVLASTKVLTTSADLATGDIEGIRALLRQAAIGADRLDMIIHATTQTSNALLERKGAR